MRPPPSLRELPRFPVTAILGVAAAAISIRWWTGADLDFLLMHPATLDTEPWRLWTSALPHVSAFHLLFDLYWLWVFGTRAEDAFGSLRTLGLFLLLQGGSAAAETALLRGGVGLSGIGYGLFGLFWVLSRRDRRYAEDVDRLTVGIFLGWALIGFATTALGLLETANVAHVAGLAFGLCCGFAIQSREPARALIWAGTLLLTGLSLLGAGPLRPHVNRVGEGTALLEHRGASALLAKHDEEAVDYLERAIAAGSVDAGTWFNLGLARERLGDARAEDAFRRAFEIAPEKRETRASLAGAIGDRARLLLLTGDTEEARAVFREGLDVDARDARLWGGLGLSLHRLGRAEEAEAAFERGREIDPLATRRWEEMHAIDEVKRAERARRAD